MMIFDAHTHFFSRVFYETLASVVPGGDVERLLGRIERAGIEIPGSDVDAHCVRWIAELDRHGIDRAVTFASVPEETEIVAAAAASSGGRLVAYATVNPLVDTTVEHFAECADRYNVKGMLLFPAMHDYAIGDPRVERALDIAKDARCITFVHCGLLKVPVRSLLGMESEFSMRNGHPKDLIPVARARPDQAFVVPHFSAGFFDELILLGRACDNVFVDTSGSNTWGNFQAPPLDLNDLFEQTIEVFGVERLFFGTDSAGFPRGYRRDILEQQMATMHGAGIGEDDRALILGGNLTRVLAL